MEAIGFLETYLYSQFTKKIAPPLDENISKFWTTLEVAIQLSLLCIFMFYLKKQVHNASSIPIMVFVLMIYQNKLADKLRYLTL